MTTFAIDGRPAGHRLPWPRLAGRAALLVVLAARVLVAPLADASPPDPTWIGGLWDDGDFDDIVGQLALLASAADDRPAPVLERPSACGPLPFTSGVPVLRLWPLPRHGRAPPLL